MHSFSFNRLLFFGINDRLILTSVMVWEDETVKRVLSVLIAAVLAFGLMSGIAIFGSAFFTALNNGLVSGIQSFLRTILYQVATVLIFPMLWDIDGIWYSIVASEGLAMLTAIIFFITMRKKYNY